MSNLIYKSEIFLDEDGLYNQVYRKNLNSIAQIIQNILLIEPGTYPNEPNLGVGIENYLFEQASSEVRQELNKKITKQIENYAPISGGKVDVIVEIGGTFNKILYISVLISSDDDYNVVKDLKSRTEIRYLFGLDNNTKSMVTKIIV